MSVKKSLGKGLGALIQASKETNSTSNEQIQEIPLNKIQPNPYQPRREFTVQKIEELAESIIKNGLLQPIVLRQQGDLYQIVSGERRFKAFQHLKSETITAIVRTYSDQEMLVNALIENIQREDLNPIDEAQSLIQLAEEFHLTHEELSQILGKSRSHISNSLRLLKLPAKVTEYIKSGLISAGGARALLTLETEEIICRMASEVVADQLNVRQIEQKVRDFQKDPKVTKVKTSTNSLESIDLEKIQRILGHKFEITSKSGKLRLIIEFTDQEDLELFLQNRS